MERGGVLVGPENQSIVDLERAGVAKDRRPWIRSTLEAQAQARLEKLRSNDRVLDNLI
jgi:hypothetical protein